MSVRIVLAEVEDVADIGAAEAIDRLVVVSDHRHIAMLRGEQVHQHVLRPVGVLVLVDKDMAKAVAPLGQRLGVCLVKLDELHDQVVEVEAAGQPQHLLIGLVDAAQDLVCVAAVGNVLGSLQLAFRL